MPKGNKDLVFDGGERKVVNSGGALNGTGAGLWSRLGAEVGKYVGKLIVVLIPLTDLQQMWLKKS